MMDDLKIMRHCAGRHDCTKCPKMAYESAHAGNMQYCSEYMARAALQFVTKAQMICELIINHKIDRSHLCEYCVLSDNCEMRETKQGKCGKFKFDIRTIKDEQDD